MKETQLKIAKDGKILPKGAHPMLGYYKDPELTAEIIDKDGWLHTGDIGEIINGGYMRITDKKRNIQIIYWQIYCTTGSKKET